MARSEFGEPRALEIEGHEVRVSSPLRPMWKSGDKVVTKADLVDFYVSVGPALLRAVGDRPTTLERWPGGVCVDGEFGEFFYNKHLPKGTPDYVGTAEVTFPSGRQATQVCPANVATIAWAANLGCVTFHPWPLRKGGRDHPDQLRLDLDPQPGTDFADAVAAAVELRSILVDVGLDPFVKTSGGRGLHVFAAIRPEWDFIDARHAGIAAGRELERRLPDLVTTNWWKEERGSAVFVDYNQMARDRTIASAWSVRALAAPTVSVPVTWDELGDVEPDEFTIATAPAVLAARGDAWATLGDNPGGLAALLEMWDRDVAAGRGEMPYPPDYPKMPGEPPRVQPSRKRSSDSR